MDNNTISLDSFLTSLISQGKRKLDEQKKKKDPAAPAPIAPFTRPVWHISHILCLHINKICTTCGDVTTDVGLFLMEIGPGQALRSTRDIPFGLENKNIDFQHEYRDDNIAFCATCAMTQEPRLLLQAFARAAVQSAPAPMPPQDLTTGKELK